MAGAIFATPSSSGHGGGAGPFGFVENLVKDIGNTARGTPEGLIQLAEHPIRSVEGMGKATWHDWSPLFHGHFGEFGHNVYQHPLAPLLDVATVFTGGASLAAKLGVGLSAAGVISEDSALARLGTMPRELAMRGPLAEGKNPIEYLKPLPKNPIYNKAARSLVSFSDKHPALPSWFGSAKTYERLQKADWGNSHLAYSVGLSAAIKAGQLFDKAGHSDWLTLEQQLSQSAYKDLLAGSRKITPEELRTKYGGRVPDGFSPVRLGVAFNKPLYDKYATNIDEFSNHIRDLGGKFLAKNKRVFKGTRSDAKYVDENGYITLAHRRAFQATLSDGAKSTHFLHTLFRYPTAIWKYAQVGISPRTVVDNSVGNWVMYTLRQGGAHGIHGFVQAVRYTRGESKAYKMLRQTGRLPEVSEMPRYFRHFKGELGNTFGTSLAEDMSKEHAGNLMSKLYANASMYPLVHKFADRPVRAASIAAHLKGDATVRGLMRSGKSFEDAADIAVAHNPVLRDRAILHARTVAGNYVTLSKGEQILRDIVPFYLWDKHIAMHTANMLRDRPAVVATGAALGQQGADTTKQQLGDIPSWMVGGIPLPIHLGDGRSALLNTQGLNPYTTVPDIAEMAQALSTGHTEDKPADTILGTVNPVIQGLIQQTMGQTGTGSPVQSHGGVVPSMLTDVVNSIRPVQFLRTALGAGKPSTTASGGPTLYKSDMSTILTALAGFPIQKAELSHAIALQKQIENHGKKPKKGHGAVFGGG